MSSFLPTYQVVESPQIEAPEAKVMLRVENISKDFGKFRALDRVSFEIREGEILGFLGPNGAGKTTAMRILTGFFPPTEGMVWIDGEELFSRPQKLKRKIGYLPEYVNLYGEMTVMEFLKFVAQAKRVHPKIRERHLEEKLTSCGLWDVRHWLIDRLSKGYRQRLGLAQALVGDPDILILDEPTNGLDPKQIIEIRTLIRELGKERTLVLSTHILPEVSMVCDRVLILNQGKVVASGTPDELEALLKDRHRIYIMMADRYRKEDALGLLRELPGVQRVDVTDERDDHVSLALEVSKEMDLRSSISRLFVEHRIPLLEIRSGKLSLEEIFLKIVVNENTEYPFS
ncbi:MAG: ABC transporter ATP-binding protein [Candidatus Omnitrophica bacterium]|nr:ABC transporter ATP-binding protein [Candidatus Omnitrophota bacterium]